MQNVKYLLAAVVLFMLSSCHWLESGRVSQKEINTASSWSDSDQFPSFEECEKLPKEEQRACFENVVIESIKLTIGEQQLVSEISIDEAIFLTIKIDKEGYFSLQNIEASSTLVEAIADLQTVLEDAVYKVPQAFPALKTNVGEFVNSTIILPIQINAKKKF